MYVITSFLKEYLNAWFLGKALGQRRSIWLNGAWKEKKKRKNKQTTTTTPLSIACEPALRPHHTPCKEIWIPESGNFLLVEFGILGLGIRNTAQGIRNPTNDCNPESKFHWQRLESTIWNPESSTAMLNIHTYKHTCFIYLESYTINSISTIPKGKSRVRWGRGWGRVEVGLFFEALPL